MNILVTGIAGFIGSRVAQLLAQRGDKVVGVDNINDYYDVRLKYARLRKLLGVEVGSGESREEGEETRVERSAIYPNLSFSRLSIDNKMALDALFESEKFDVVVNLAAQAGVRYSITHPYTYMQSNLIGFLNILDACRNYHVPRLVFASSSSVYGLNDKVPYNENDKVDSPVSLYAASKKSNELMAHCYSKLYGFQSIGLRYFTVYGPWGRPDMSPMLFANAMRDNQPIRVFNNGDMIRDFTYIDDIAQGTVRAIDHNLDSAVCEHGVPYRIYNIGCSHPVKLMDFISEMEAAFGKQAKKEFLPMQAGDVYQTNADCTRLEKEMGYRPRVELHEGLQNFVRWYQAYYCNSVV